MVQVDISQLTRECSGWREQLRMYREEFTQDETKLRYAAGQPLSKEQLQKVEHLHNQFHIQLINIHDLKQSVKVHDRKMNFEMAAFNGTANEDTLARHEALQNEYATLQQTLKELRAEFNDFLNQMN
jgi:ABC-type phosphate transport system auxiliary subunit